MFAGRVIVRIVEGLHRNLQQYFVLVGAGVLGEFSRSAPYGAMAKVTDAGSFANASAVPEALMPSPPMTWQ